MVLLRSEAELPASGETLTVAELADLAQAWYGDRLAPDWRPRSRDESQRLLADLGLDSPFWDLP